MTSSLSWALGIRKRLRNDPGRSDLEDQIQCHGLLFLDEYLEDVLSGPRQQSIIDLVKTPGRKKDASKKARAATAAALASAREISSPVKVQPDIKENVTPVNDLQKALLRARDEDQSHNSLLTGPTLPPVKSSGKTVKIDIPPQDDIAQPLPTSPPRPPKSPLRTIVRAILSPRSMNGARPVQFPSFSPQRTLSKHVPEPIPTPTVTQLPPSQPSTNLVSSAQGSVTDTVMRTADAVDPVPPMSVSVAHTHIDEMVPLKDDADISSPQPPTSPPRLHKGLPRKPSVPNFSALPVPSPIRKSVGTALSAGVGGGGGGGNVRSSWLKKARETRGFEGIKRTSAFPGALIGMAGGSHKRKSDEMLGAPGPEPVPRAPKVAKVAGKSLDPGRSVVHALPAPEESISRAPDQHIPKSTYDLVPPAAIAQEEEDEDDTQHRLERLAKTVSGMAPVDEEQENTQSRLERLMKTVGVTKPIPNPWESNDAPLTEDDLLPPRQAKVSSDRLAAPRSKSADLKISTTPSNSPPLRPLPIPSPPVSPPVVFKAPTFRLRPSEDVKPVPIAQPIFKPTPAVQPSLFIAPPAPESAFGHSAPQSQTQYSTQSTYIEDEDMFDDASKRGGWPSGTYSTVATSQESLRPPSSQDSKPVPDSDDAFPGWELQPQSDTEDVADEQMEDDATLETAVKSSKMSISTNSTIASKTLGGSTTSKSGLWSLQRAAAAAKKEQEEKDKKAARLKEMEGRRIAIQEKKLEEERNKTVEAERRQREESDKRKRDREEAGEKKAFKGTKTLTQVEEFTKKKVVELKGPTADLKKPPSKDKKMKPPSFVPSHSQPQASSSQPVASASNFVKSTILKYSTVPPSGFQSSLPPDQSTVAPTIKLVDNSKTLSTKLPPKPLTALVGRQPLEAIQAQMQARVDSQRPAQQPAQSTLVTSESIELEDIASEYSDSDDEERQKPVRPDWTASPALRQALDAQRLTNPDDIFGPIRPLQMEEFFRNGSRFRARSSSANWHGTDGLTMREELEYARRMGFR